LPETTDFSSVFTNPLQSTFDRLAKSKDFSSSFCLSLSFSQFI